MLPTLVPAPGSHVSAVGCRDFDGVESTVVGCRWVVPQRVLTSKFLSDCCQDFVYVGASAIDECHRQKEGLTAAVGRELIQHRHIHGRVVAATRTCGKLWPSRR